MNHFLNTPLLIIGGGATGTALARDMALRGVRSVLVEKGSINSDASGGNHGLLHSGGRYVSSDPAVAQACREENEILRRVAPHCIEETGGLFVAVEGDDEHYVADFPHRCTQTGIPVENLDILEARELEPALSDRIIAAFHVRDAAIDPFRISLENMAKAQQMGATLLHHTRVVGFRTNSRRIEAATLRDLKTVEQFIVEPDQVVAASGAWIGDVATLAGISIPIMPPEGTLLVTDRRVTGHVINRLRPPGDGDVLVPSGTVSILGTTSIRLSSLDDIRPTVAETDLIVQKGAVMVPVLEKARYIRAYSGVRPLLTGGSVENDRSVSRGFSILDHTQHGLENFLTIAGGELTTHRLMAEKAADQVCERLGVSAACSTKTRPLPDTMAGRWTEPGLGPRHWLRRSGADVQVLCGCEILPKTIIDNVMLFFSCITVLSDMTSVTLQTTSDNAHEQRGFLRGAIIGHHSVD